MGLSRPFCISILTFSLVRHFWCREKHIQLNKLTTKLQGHFFYFDPIPASGTAVRAGSGKMLCWWRHRQTAAKEDLPVRGRGFVLAYLLREVREVCVHDLGYAHHINGKSIRMHRKTLFCGRGETLGPLGYCTIDPTEGRAWTSSAPYRDS